MNQCSRRLGGHDIPSAIPSPGEPAGVTIFSQDSNYSNVQGGEVLTRQPLPVASLPDDRPANPH